MGGIELKDMEGGAVTIGTQHQRVTCCQGNQGIEVDIYVQDE